MNKDKIHVLDFLMIALGCAFYGYGLVNVNIANNLAEGGVTGVTLIIRYWLHIDPAYTTVLINVPLILIGYRYLGKKSLLYTVYGTLSLSFFIWLWQRVSLPVNLNVQHDMFLAGILAGLPIWRNHRRNRRRCKNFRKAKRNFDGQNFAVA